MDQSTYQLCEAVNAETKALTETIKADNGDHYSQNIIKSIGCIRNRIAKDMQWK